jgi:hypothetical protein
MRQFFFTLLALPIWAVTACTGPAHEVGVDVVQESDFIDVGDLTEIACDFKVYPLKADIPLDGIGGIKCWGHKMFARSNDDKRLLCFDDYKLYAVLDRLGRGPGEYIYLSDFSYDEKENLIYVGNDSVICVYDGTTTAFIRKQYVTFDTQNLLNVGDKMLYYGLDIDESRKRDDDTEYNPTQMVILADRAEWDLKNNRTVLYSHSFARRLIYGFPQLFYVNPQNMSFCIPGYVNRIVTFDNDSVTDVYKFQLEPALGNEVVNRYKDEELADGLSGTVFANDYVNMLMEGKFITNTYNIIVDKGTVSFRVNYCGVSPLADSEDLRTTDYNGYLYWVHNKSGTNVYKKLRIPGLIQFIDPTGCHDNRNVAIIENLGEDAFDDTADMSPLAREILDELKKQNDDNPVVLEFRFK